MTYHIYTDGAASPNPGTGGWAFVVVVNNKIVSLYNLIHPHL